MWIVFECLIVSLILIVVPKSIDAFWFPKTILYLIGGWIFIASCWLSVKKQRYIFKNKWLAYLLIYAVLSFGWIFFRPLLFEKQGRVTWELWNLFPSLNLILGLLIIHHLVEYTDSVNRWLSVVKVICWSGVGISLYALTQHFGFDQFMKTEIIEGAERKKIFIMATTFGNKMLTSNFIAMTIPLFLIFRKRKYYIGLAICLTALLFFRSIFNFGSALIGIFLILFLQKRKRLLTTLLTICIILFFTLGSYLMPTYRGKVSNIFNGRLSQWKVSLIKSTDYLWTGRGLGSYWRDYHQPKEGKGWNSSHNLFIDFQYEMGLIGIFLVIAYLFDLFKKLKELFSYHNESLLLIGLCGGFLTYLLISMGSFPHLIAPLALVGIIYIAGLEVHLSRRIL